MGRLGSSWYEEKAGPAFVECQEGRVQSPGGGLQRKNTSPGMKSPGLSPSSALPFPTRPLLRKMLRHSVLSFPICETRPTSQPISESKLGRMQGVTGQGPAGGSDRTHSFHSSSTSQCDVHQGTKPPCACLICQPDETAVTTVHINIWPCH